MLSGVVDIEEVVDIVVDAESVVAIVDVESLDVVVLDSSVVLLLEQAEVRAMTDSAKRADLRVVFMKVCWFVELVTAVNSRIDKR